MILTQQHVFHFHIKQMALLEGREGPREGVIIQPISRQTDSNIEARQRGVRYEEGRERESGGSSPSLDPLRILECRNISH